ncbi:MAG: IS1595 family transposase [Chitinophagales bacterium]
MKKYTLQQFNAEYSDDNACLDKLYKLRFTGLVCPKCESEKEFTRVNDRRSYQCPCCGFQVYPTAGTIFHKSTTSLKVWFHAIYMQTTTRNGVSAKELERTFDICYKTALRMAHQIKMLMANESVEPLTGIVETDETFIGGKSSFMHESKRAKLSRNGNGLSHIVPLVAIVQRDGEVRTTIIEEANKENLYPNIEKNISKEAILVTDGLNAYNEIGRTFIKHESVSHGNGEYVRGQWHTNTVEGFFSQLKRTIKGTHIHVSKRHLQKYADEVAFRYMNRDRQNEMFNLVLARVAS